ncbi:MAG: hypothetical protein ACPGNV_15640 [Mangrovicoccus sp.]
MKRPGRPVFLERESYRQRRVVDACRLVPLFGLAFFLIPLLWPEAPTEGAALAQRGAYIFSVWFGLVWATAWLSMKLTQHLNEAPRSTVKKSRTDTEL